MNWAQAENLRENRNRKKIEDSWGPEVLSLFRTSSRSEFVEVVKTVKKFPVYQDARNRINLLIIQRLTDKNSKPTLQKVFTRPGGWIKVASENKLVAEPIPYKTLLNLNIRLGPHDVLETGPPSLPFSVPNTTTNTVPPSTHELEEKTPISSSSHKVTGTLTTGSTTEGNSFFLLNFNITKEYRYSSLSFSVPTSQKKSWKKERNAVEIEGDSRSKRANSTQSISSNKPESDEEDDSLVEREDKENSMEEKIEGGEKREEKGVTSARYRRFCKNCDKRIPNWVLKDMEFSEKPITMQEEISRWGNLWIRLGWKFCPQHLSIFADHMFLVEVSEKERLKRLRAMHENRDPQALVRLVIKNLEWFEPAETLWFYGNKRGLNTDLKRFAGEEKEENSG